jgi:hypothetical protein
VEDRLDKIAALEPNWDSYGALSIDPRAVAEVRSFLKKWPKGWSKPFIVPTTSGGIALEWQDDEDFTMIWNPDGTFRVEEDDDD